MDDAILTVWSGCMSGCMSGSMSGCIPPPLRAALDTFRVLAHNPPLYLASVEALRDAVEDLAAEVAPSCDCGRARAGECRECNRRDAMEAKGDWAGEVADDMARFGC
jgi:hypothetical protein